jgi:hypothetical protein
MEHAQHQPAVGWYSQRRPAADGGTAAKWNSGTGLTVPAGVLLQTLGNTGHFPEREEDAYRFLLHELGVKQNSPAGRLSPTEPQLRSGRISRDRCR